MKPQATYLGHRLSDEGKQMFPERQETIAGTPKPQTKKQMTAFWGLCNYCKHYVENYAKITNPLV